MEGAALRCIPSCSANTGNKLPVPPNEFPEGLVCKWLFIRVNFYGVE